jgi:hypothetical protein
LAALVQCGDAVQVGPDAIVGIGEDEVTAGGRCQRAPGPSAPPFLPGRPRGDREISEVEQVIEEACPGVKPSKQPELQVVTQVTGVTILHMPTMTY